MIVIERDTESGWYIGSVPLLPGVFSQAKSIDELKVRMAEAIRGMLNDMQAHGEELPGSEFISTVNIPVEL